MPKNLLIFSVVLFLVLSVYSPVHAVFIQVDDQGDVLMFEDTVLGETDEVETNTEEKKEEEKKEERPVKTIPADARKVEKTEIRLKPTSKDETTLEIKKKDGEKSRTVEKKAEDRVKLEFKDKEKELRELRMSHEKEIKEFKINLDGTTEEKQEKLKLKELELSKELEVKKAEMREFEETGEVTAEQNEETRLENEQLRPILSPKVGEEKLSEEEKEKRQADRKEKVMKLRDAIRDNKRELQLEGSDGVTARFGEGAEVVVDAETGTVTLVTPSGVEKELNNLPDEVIARLKERQNLNTEGSSEVEVEVDANGDIKHKIKNVKRQRKLFGFIPREVAVDAVVDDATGEVEITEGEQSPVDQILNAFSL